MQGALADAIIRALRCSTLRAESAETGNQRVREKFTPDHRATQFLKVYEELITLHG